MSAFEIAYNQVKVTLEDGFTDAVKQEMAALQRAMESLVKGMFTEIAGVFGSDDTPGVISRYTTWDNLTDETIDRKKSGSNRFYLGLSGGLRKAVSNRSKGFPYGPPTVTIGTGLGRGFDRSSGRVRIARGFAGAGRFASAARALRVTLEITPFSQLPEDLTSIFKGGKLRYKAESGEFGASNRPARPFLAPFVQYYTDVRTPEIIQRVMQL
jgi:hypothetical protein